jgi:hypothetical protein
MLRRFKRNKTVRNIMDTTMIGAGSMVGAGMLGKLGGMSGGSSSIANTAMTGLELANIGQMSKVGLGVMDGLESPRRRRRRR